MSYRQGGYRGALTGGALAIPILAIGGRLAFNAFWIANAPPAIGSPADAVHVLLNDPVRGRAFAALQRSFPEAFGQLTKQIAESSKPNETASDVADRAGPMFDAILSRHRDLLAQAPPAALAASREAAAALAEALQEEPEACTSFMAHRTFTVTFATKLPSAEVAAYRHATIEAEAAGRDDPAGRHIDRLGPEVGERLRTALTDQGMRDAAAKSFLINGTKVTSIEQCAFGIEYFRALGSLDEDDADQVGAYFAGREG